MRKLNKHIGVPTLVRTGLVIFAVAVALLATWAGTVAGSGADFEDSYKASPRFAESGDVIACARVAVNSGDLDDVVLSTAVAAESAPTQEEEVNTLRVYGRAG
ncbi:MAG: hypothetical protein ISS49_10480, partial [Anaerolineae bacterium]|nr:hypothetical protein [Anaerolineae bacterium]